MRILLTTYFSLPTFTGLNTYINVLKAELEEHGHQVDVLAHHPSMEQTVYLVNGGATIDKTEIRNVVYGETERYFKQHWPNVDPWVLNAEMGRYTFELAASLLRLHQYDLIHAQDVISARAMRRVKPEQVPLVATIHGIYTKELLYYGWITDQESLQWKYMAEQERLGVVSPYCALVPTKWMKNEFRNVFRIPERRLKISPYGINVEQFLRRMKAEPDSSIEPPPGTFVMACVARIDPIKGHKTLMEALSLLKEKQDHFVCWLIGGCYQKELQAELEKERLTRKLENHVIFLGDRADVPALLHRADIMILPSLQENHPFAIMEAHLAGTAVVASDAGGIPEMIRHEENGLLFEKQNAAQLADKLLTIMNRPKLRLRMEAAARARGIKRWSSDSLYRRIMQVYDQARASVQPAQPNAVKASVWPASLFLFETDRSWDTGPWPAILRHLPAGYSIPDIQFMKWLAAKEGND
ncbi:glycosyltransferase family 4 protein [Paenibacillus doosanensis]|uniref:glycosyltransferase family 4 protein n=1 Tax=Paenibacillus doosanensis TaxID=1229154 RepID=UPI00217F7AA3|nr:glycosyltransferase family 4 protein [Paenibacillus doosanensis]MCS7458804.1 glycosyltransferase family 4 protein [Paenibacillus doosanensis]